MTDLISRKEARELLHQQLVYRMNNESMKERLDNWLDSVPEADLSCGDCIYNDGKLYAACEGCARAGFDNYTQEGGD